MTGGWSGLPGPTRAEDAAMLRLAVLVCLLAAAGCAPARPLQPVEPTAAERRLIQYLTRDPYVTIERLERNDDGQLVVSTVQGGGHCRYLLAPDAPDDPTLRLRLLADACTMDTLAEPRQSPRDLLR
jgi:hypothetical protein